MRKKGLKVSTFSCARIEGNKQERGKRVLARTFQGVCCRCIAGRTKYGLIKGVGRKGGTFAEATE